MDSQIFTPCQIGPITLRNRSIRSAAFENMCYGNKPSQDLFDYHTAVAKGGIGMTTIAYAAVNRSGVSFDGQLWMREEIVPDLKKLTDAIHAEGAKASIQIGHCGNMTHRSTCKCKPVGASGGFNLYSPTFVRKLKEEEIYGLVKDFGKAVNRFSHVGMSTYNVDILYFDILQHNPNPRIKVRITVSEVRSDNSISISFFRMNIFSGLSLITLAVSAATAGTISFDDVSAIIFSDILTGTIF